MAARPGQRQGAPRRSGQAAGSKIARKEEMMPPRKPSIERPSIRDVPKGAKYIEMGDHRIFWTLDNWQTAYQLGKARKVSDEQLKTLHLLQAFGAAAGTGG